MSRDKMVKIAEASVKAAIAGTPLLGKVRMGHRLLGMEQIKQTLREKPEIASVVLEAIRDHGPSQK